MSGSVPPPAVFFVSQRCLLSAWTCQLSKALEGRAIDLHRPILIVSGALLSHRIQPPNLVKWTSISYSSSWQTMMIIFSLQYTALTFNVVHYSILSLLVSGTTIQWPCIVCGYYTSRLPIQQYSATIEHWSCLTVQLYNTMWLISSYENLPWQATIGVSVRLQEYQRRSFSIPANY